MNITADPRGQMYNRTASWLHRDYMYYNYLWCLITKGWYCKFATTVAATVGDHRCNDSNKVSEQEKKLQYLWNEARWDHAYWLLWSWTKRKSHTRFRLVPKSMTLDDLERPIRTLTEKMRFTEPTTKIWMKIDPYYQPQKFRPITVQLFSGNIKYMRVFLGEGASDNSDWQFSGFLGILVIWSHLVGMVTKMWGILNTGSAKNL